MATTSATRPLPAPAARHPARARRPGRVPPTLAAGALALLACVSLAPPAAAQSANVIGVTITEETTPGSGSYFRLRFTFAEDVGGFSRSDLSATNATLSNLVSATGAGYGDLRRWIVDVTPAASGDVTVTLPAGSACAPVITPPRCNRRAQYRWERNSTPVIANPGDKTYRQGETITAFGITVTDADTDDTVTVSVSGLPSGLEYSSTTGKVSGTVASKADPKNYTVRISAADATSRAATSFTITVTKANAPPVITAPANRTYAQGDSITAFGITVTDVDDDALTVGVTGLPSGLSYSTSAKQVSGTVAADADVKAYTVTITANDGVAPEVSATFTVTVTRTNTKPDITAPDDKRYSQGEAILPFYVRAADSDGIASLTVTGLPSGLSYALPNVGPGYVTMAATVSGTVAADAAVKTYTVTITASDGDLEATATFSIVVAAAQNNEVAPDPQQPANAAPVITDPGNKTYAQGETITAFAITVTDDGDTPSVAVSGLPSGLGWSSAYRQVSGTVAADAAAQDYTVTVTADDGVNAAVTLDFTVTVTAAAPTPQPVSNRQPVITDPGGKTYEQGETITAFGITVTDPDDDATTVSVSGLPSGLSWSSSAGQVSGTVAADATVQDWTVTITANDGVTPEVTLDFTVTVTAAAPAPDPPNPQQPTNAAPVITDPGDKTYAQGEAITAFGITVTDADDDALTVSVSGLPSGLGWSSSAGQVSGTVASDATVQDFTVTVTANDGVNAEVTLDFTVTVTAATPAPDPPDPSDPPDPEPTNVVPVITNPGDKEYVQGEAITAFGITVTDADDDALTVSVSGLPSGLGWSSSAGQVSGTVASDAAVQDYAVTVTADDAVNPEVTLDFTVTVTTATPAPDPPDAPDPPALNSAPVITDPGDKEYSQGEEIAAFGITVTDPDDDAMTVSVSGLPPGLGWSSSAGQVSGTVASNAAVRAWTVTVTVNDAVNPEVTLDFTVTVLAAAESGSDPAASNGAPVITDPGDKSYAQGETIDAFPIEVTDPDDDDVAVGVGGLPSGLRYASGTVQGTVAADAAVRDYTVTITATDHVNPSVRADFTTTIKVTHADDPGVVVNPTRLVMQEGVSRTYRVALREAPQGPVTVAVRYPAGVSVTPRKLTIPMGTWDEPRTVTVTGKEAATLTLSHAVSGGGYDGVPASDVAVKVIGGAGDADGPASPDDTPAPGAMEDMPAPGMVEDVPGADVMDDARDPAHDPAAGVNDAPDAGDADRPRPRVEPARKPVNRAPRFGGGGGLGFELSENLDGRQEPVALGVVRAVDPDAGDRLTYALAAGDATRFAVDAASGAVRYVGPGEDFEAGPERYGLTVRATDREGLSATASVGVRVVNEEEAGVVTLSTLAPLVAAALTAVLADPDGGVADERWQWERRVAGAWRAIAGATAPRYVPAVGDVGARLRAAVTYGDGHGPDKRAVSVETAPVRIDPARRAAALEAVLGAFGRTVASSAIDALDARFEAAALPRAGWRATVGGQEVTAETFDLTQGAPPLVLDHLAALAAQRPAAGYDPFAPPGGLPGGGGTVTAALGADPIGGALGSRTWVGRGGLASTGPSPFRHGSFRDRFARSDFEMPLTADPAAAAAGGVPAGWTIWGRGDVTSLLGRPDAPPEGAVALDGDVASGLAGVDYRWGARGLLGVAVSRHAGTVDYDGAGVGPGSVAAGVTNVQPYVRWAPRPGLSVWGLAGAGWGAARLADAEYTALETDLGLRLAAAGVRQELAVTGRVAWAARADAFAVALSTEAAAGLPAVEAAARRGRVLLEGRTDWAVTETSRLTPRVELGARVDGGSADRGAGLEVGGGLTYLHLRSGLSVEGRARRLLAHQAERFAEWGASLTVRIDPGRSGRGLTFALAPVWGVASSGVASLWGAPQGRVALGGLGGLPGRRPGGAWRPDAWRQEVGYGLEVGGRRLTPYATVAQYDAARQIRMGARLGFGGVDDPAAGRPDRFHLEVMDERVTGPGAPADHRFAVAGVFSFGARGRAPASAAAPAGG